MEEKLSGTELKSLIQSVFSLSPNDKKLAILIDSPDKTIPDNPQWKKRREIAQDWTRELKHVKSDLHLESIDLVAYRNVHSNNADLPEVAYIIKAITENMLAENLTNLGLSISMKQILSDHQIVIAPTEFSATAPLKLLSKNYGFRAVTMPGFSREMIPALKLDYEEINRRVNQIKDELDPAIGMEMKFKVQNENEYLMHFDLRHRKAHASGGRFPNPGTAGNLPSGEAYIVPYEGELEDDSLSQGILPVQFEDEIVLYSIKKNKAVDIHSEGKYSDIEREKIKREPAYANISELGFGVLKDFGCTPTGSILMDEKLGLHIAFGRSDHFGGAIGVKDFSSPEKVVHIDRIYIPETQNRIDVEFVNITLPDGISKNLMRNGSYTIFS